MDVLSTTCEIFSPPLIASWPRFLLRTKGVLYNNVNFMITQQQWLTFLEMETSDKPTEASTWPIAR